ncbi:MAG: sulfotransferase domain-containing protein [Actinomycetes bacterium]
MARLGASIRPVASSLSPRARRYRAFLRSLPLDPETLSATLEPPDPGSFVMCGCPRTGTTLLSAALYQPPTCVTVMEPWDGMRLEPASLFRSLRAEIAGGTLTRGRLDQRALGERGVVRWISEGDAAWPVTADVGHLLGVKWTSWWRFIDRLPTTPFLVCLRNPAEVVASMRDAGGRVKQGLQYETPFNRRLNDSLRAATDDQAVRRILLFDNIHEQLAPLLERDNVLVVRYERWSTDREALLGDVSRFLGRDLSHAAVQVRPSQRLRMDRHEIDLLRAHCKTAEMIGYELP